MTQFEGKTFESVLVQLQNTVKSLESGELTLDEALKKFEEGVQLTQACQKIYATAEQKVEVLMKANAENNGTVQLEPFKP